MARLGQISPPGSVTAIRSRPDGAGPPCADTAFDTAARALLAGAVGQGDNSFKIGLAHKAIVRALNQAAAGTPQSQTDKRIR